MRFLQRYLGWAAIPNLTLWIIVFQVFAYIALHVPMQGANQQLMLDRLTLDPERVFAGEWWRVISFVFFPPVSNVLFAFFAWWLFHLMGTSLEAYWGTFRYNLFVWVWWLATVAVALVLRQPPIVNYYLHQSVFLAFAFLNPDFTLLIFFVLPVKVKWLAWLAWAGVLLTLILGNWGERASVLAGVANFLIFFGPEIRDRAVWGTRRMRRDAARMTQREPAYFHKCVVCGVTDRTHPETEFRYCSKCAGQQCYCSEHLHDHEHVSSEALSAGNRT